MNLSEIYTKGNDYIPSGMFSDGYEYESSCTNDDVAGIEIYKKRCKQTNNEEKQACCEKACNDYNSDNNTNCSCHNSDYGHCRAPRGIVSRGVIGGGGGLTTGQIIAIVSGVILLLVGISIALYYSSTKKKGRK